MRPPGKRHPSLSYGWGWALPHCTDAPLLVVFGRLQHTLPQLKFKFQQRYLQQQAPPKTCQEHEILLVELEGRDREHRLLIDQLHVDIKLKESIIDNIKDENMRLKDKIEELEEEIKLLDEELKKAENLEEMEEMIAVVKQKNERVEELEEALRQSVTIASDMETERNEEDGHMREITQKVKTNSLGEILLQIFVNPLFH